MHKHIRAASLALAMALVGSTLACAQPAPQAGADFAQQRAKVKTSVGYGASYAKPLPKPPKGMFQKVTYTSPVGQLGAYVTPDPGDGKKHPAIIWITGGESNSVSDVWTPAPRENDQNATAYRQAGIVTMFPTLRGGNNNPGKIEGMFGEIDDILAAANYLASLPYVDPSRIYLGGHSTGGTLVLLTAEASDRFRAVFSVGPVARSRSYPPQFLPIDFKALPAWEERLRAPIEWLPSVKGRLLVVEAEQGNIGPLRAMRSVNRNPNISFLEFTGTNHFSDLAPLNAVLARKILADTGTTPNIVLTEDELQAALAKP
jgi:hypothetical protein